MSNKNNSFETSMTDLMISLALIFMLLLSAVMLKLNNQAQDLTKTKNDIIVDLTDILNQMQKKGIEVKSDEKDPLTLKVVLGEGEDTLKFQTGKYDLRQQDKDFLNELMPTIIGLLCNEKYQDSIDSIKIEGYTDDDKYKGLKTYSNVELSQDRALSVLNHTRQILDNEEEKNFFIDKASVNGKGDIETYWIKNNDGSCNKDKSRRVEIKIKIKSKDEEKLEKKLLFSK